MLFRFSDLLFPQTIVILSPEKPSHETWSRLRHFPGVYFIQGTQKSRTDLVYHFSIIYSYCFMDYVHMSSHCNRHHILTSEFFPANNYRGTKLWAKLGSADSGRGPWPGYRSNHKYAGSYPAMNGYSSLLFIYSCTHLFIVEENQHFHRRYPRFCKDGVPERCGVCHKISFALVQVLTDS